MSAWLQHILAGSPDRRHCVGEDGRKQGVVYTCVPSAFSPRILTLIPSSVLPPLSPHNSLSHSWHHQCSPDYQQSPTATQSDFQFYFSASLLFHSSFALNGTSQNERPGFVQTTPQSGLEGDHPLGQIIQESPIGHTARSTLLAERAIYPDPWLHSSTLLPIDQYAESTRNRDPHRSERHKQMAMP
jgi:hypothetical protein